MINPLAEQGNVRNRILEHAYHRMEAEVQVTWTEYRDFIMEYMPNLGLVTIAGYLGPEHDVTYVEEEQQGLHIPDGTDLVILSPLNNQATRAYRIAEECRRRGIPTMIGGFHATSLPEEAAEYCDAVAIGEGEDIFPRMMADFEAGRLEKFYRSSQDVDLTRVPMPRFELLTAVPGMTKVPIQATRGCPHNCEFCCLKVQYGPKYRRKTVDQVIAELVRLKELYPEPFVSFTDDNLFVHRKWCKELMERMAPLEIGWEAYTDIGAAEDPELLRMAAEAGCQEVFIGLETLDPDNLALMDPWKSRKLHRYGEYVQRFQEAGIAVMGLFIAGYDYDDEACFERIHEFVRETEMFDADFSMLCPIPGTQLFARMVREGRLHSENWDLYTWYHPVFKPRRMSAERLIEGLVWLFEEFNGPRITEERVHYFKERAAVKGRPVPGWSPIDAVRRAAAPRRSAVSQRGLDLAHGLITARKPSSPERESVVLA